MTPEGIIPSGMPAPLRWHDPSVKAALARAAVPRPSRQPAMPKRARDRQRAAAVRHARLADVRCTACGDPQLETETLCARCAERLRDSSRAQRRKT